MLKQADITGRIRALRRVPATFGSLQWLSAAAFVALGLVTVWMFVHNVRLHYFWGDDCYISFRYARQLVLGHGLVWNPGEHVEGYTNFLWVLIMALGMVVGIEPELLSNVLGIASGVAVMGGLMWLSARWQKGWTPLVWVAPLVLAFSRSFTGWTTGGLATMFFTMLVLFAFLRLFVEREDPARRPWVSALLFALATLTRPEGVLFAFAAGVFFTLDVIRKKRRLRSLLIWTGVYCALAGGHLLWRRWYYGFWLPNTFYAKVSGAWWNHARFYFKLFESDYHLLWFTPLALLPLIFRRSMEVWMFLFTTLLFGAYVGYVGGDRFEFRFLVFVFPLAYALLADGIAVLVRFPVKTTWLRAVTAAAGIAALVLLAGVTHQGSINPKAGGKRGDNAGIRAINEYATGRAAEGRFLRSLIDKGLLPKDVLLAVGGAGAVPYYTMWPTLDILGLNNVEIGHMPIKKRGVIGHEKVASKEFLRAHRIEMWDAANRLVHDKKGRSRSCKGDEGCWKAVDVAGRTLKFVTFLSDEEFARRFGNPGLKY